ncbi:MAG: hypothetical protein M0P71_16190 [Melioribacteraceae bacterium]|jgi:hypothetical protein|nr:hypothetical protein [Melioribacteraceae bacterium]
MSLYYLERNCNIKYDYLLWRNFHKKPYKEVITDLSKKYLLSEKGIETVLFPRTLPAKEGRKKGLKKQFDTKSK